MRSSLLAWKTGPLGTEYELLLQRKGGKAKSILPLAVILFIFFPYTFFLFSTFSSLNVKSQADYIFTVICVSSLFPLPVSFSLPLFCSVLAHTS